MIKQVKGNILGSSDWSPSARSEKSKVAEQGAARLSDWLPVASGLARLGLAQANCVKKHWARSLRVRLSLAQANAHQFSQKFSGFKPFSPKNPNFDLSQPKTRSK